MKQTILIVLGVLTLLSCRSNKQEERKENFTVKFSKETAYTDINKSDIKTVSSESETKKLLNITSDSTKNYVDSVGFNYILAKSRMFIPAEKGTWFVCPYKNEESKYVICYKSDEGGDIFVYPAFVSEVCQSRLDMLLFVKYESNSVYGLGEPFITVGPFNFGDGKNYLVKVEIVNDYYRLKMDKSRNPDGTLKDETKSSPDFEYVICSPVK